ncbi:retropepsin-like aspartic protease family protein [Oricola nitratireducens]|uniref:retropepsin-like aspartic protease family protein n=1 Tax=Oricola nitratireducens TaxID=2775868 RepID=UPI0018660919|nr:TIGR02281 family clan AA aspartic protease [Oricola nitratireducens]
MNPFAFLVFGILGASLLVLIFNGNDGTIGPMTESQFAGTVYLGLFGTVLAAGLFASGQRFGEMARQAGIWLAIIIMLVIGYEYRFELHDTAARVTSGLIPGEPVSSQSADGSLSVTINRRGRHFETSGTVNGSRQTFLVDTGASTVVLTEENARKAGIDPDSLDFHIPVATANGTAMAARVTGLDIAIGGITRRNITALVASDSQLSSNLLGMNFLDTLHSFEVRRDRMVLRN